MIKPKNRARHGIAEHHEIDELIKELEDTEYSSSAWLNIAKNLQEKVKHHLDEEEHEFFQLAGKIFSENDKARLAEEYQIYMVKNR